MTFTVAGFAGSVDEDQWGQILARAGGDYSVGGPGDLKVSIVTGGGDRVVRVAAGSAYARGVLATETGTTDLTLSSVGSGSRWDTIVLRRDRNEGTAQLLVLTGTASQAYAAGRKVMWADGQDDQVLALARVTAGQSQVQEVSDERCWVANGGMVAASIRVLGTLAGAGTSVWVGDTLWRKRVTDGGVVETVPAIQAAPVIELGMSGSVAAGPGGYQVPWAVEREKQGLSHSTSTANDDVTAPTPGVYRVSGAFEHTGAASGGWRDFVVRRNGAATHLRCSSVTSPNNPLYYAASLVPGLVRLAAGDVVDVLTTGSQDADFQESRCRLSIEWVRP